MGVSFLWLSLRIPHELTSRVATRFAEAVAASPMSPTAQRVLERWRESPLSLIPEFVPDPARPGALTHAEGTVEFEELFRSEALSGFGQEFFMRGVAPGSVQASSSLTASQPPRPCTSDWERSEWHDCRATLAPSSWRRAMSVRSCPSWTP
jgi:hypothetical protein